MSIDYQLATSTLLHIEKLRKISVVFLGRMSPKVLSKRTVLHMSWRSLSSMEMQHRKDNVLWQSAHRRREKRLLMTAKVLKGEMCGWRVSEAPSSVWCPEEVWASHKKPLEYRFFSSSTCRIQIKNVLQSREIFWIMVAAIILIPKPWMVWFPF